MGVTIRRCCCFSHFQRDFK